MVFKLETVGDANHFNSLESFPEPEINCRCLRGDLTKVKIYQALIVELLFSFSLLSLASFQCQREAKLSTRHGALSSLSREYQDQQSDLACCHCHLRINLRSRSGSAFMGGLQVFA
jgi:hypothetical protein